MDAGLDVIVLTRLEHERLYLDLGWLNLGDILFKVKPSVDPAPYRLRFYLRPGV